MRAGGHTYGLLQDQGKGLRFAAGAMDPLQWNEEIPTWLGHLLARWLSRLLACLLTERVAVVPFFWIGTPYRCDQSQHCPSFPLDLRSFPSSKRASPPFRDCFLVDHTGRSLCSSAGNFVFHATAPGTAHELSQRYSATHSCLSSRLTSSTYIDDMSYIIDQHSRERRIEGRERERGRER